MRLDIDLQRCTRAQQCSYLHPELFGRTDEDFPTVLAPTVEADQREGRRIGVSGTPTVFVNGRRLRKRNIEGFSALIDDELNKLKAAKAKPAS